MPGPARHLAGSSGAVLSAAVAYWSVVFATGFVLGAVRVTALAPRFGATAAVALEIPVMLAVSFVASRRLCSRFAVPARPRPRLAMGGVAFALLLAAEAGLAVFGFGETVTSWAASLGSAPGFLGLLGQVAFALTPLVQATATRTS